MDKFKRFSGVILLIVILGLAITILQSKVLSLKDRFDKSNASVEETTKNLDNQQAKKRNIEAKLAKLKNSSMTVQKKIYAPVDSDLGSDTIFFTLYSDLLEMIHSNSVKIQTLDYEYNPADDPFVKSGGAGFFVSEVNMKLIANYVNLGKLVQDLYQYPYYIRMISLSVKPYEKDKKILLANLKVRLYSRTEPFDEEELFSGIR